MADGSADANGLVLWGATTSRTLRAHWALAELGLDYQSRPIEPRSGETKTPEYTALTARQKIPLLQDRGLTITESAAIVAYLSDAYAQDHNRLVPIGAVPRAKCMEWCFFIISEVDAASLYVIRRHQDLKHIYGDAPQANLAAAGYLQQQMRAIDRQLADGRRFLLDDRFSAADLLLSTCISWAGRYGLPVSSAAITYNSGLTTRETYRQAVLRNRAAGAATPAATDGAAQPG